jgi:D-alanine-D-alanine ligase
MNVVVLHGEDALGPPRDPVLDQISDALTEGGNHPATIAVAPPIEPVIEQLRAASPDLVFNLTESFDGKSALDASLAALLNLIGLRYTGSSPAGLVLAGDKILTKKVLGFHGMLTPDFATAYRGALDHVDDLRFPLIVKPAQEDASIGITQGSIVGDLRELLEKMDELQTQYQQPVLIEQFIAGREFYVGVLGNANAESLPIIELTFADKDQASESIASYEVKWAEAGEPAARAAESVVGRDLPTGWAERMQRIALDAFHALRLRDYARIDMRVADDGDVYIIEVNPNCYLERKSEFALAAEAAGIGYAELINRIVELANARYAR